MNIPAARVPTRLRTVLVNAAEPVAWWTVYPLPASSATKVQRDDGLARTGPAPDHEHRLGGEVTWRQLDEARLVQRWDRPNRLMTLPGIAAMRPEIEEADFRKRPAVPIADCGDDGVNALIDSLEARSGTRPTTFRRRSRSLFRLHRGSGLENPSAEQSRVSPSGRVDRPDLPHAPMAYDFRSSGDGLQYAQVTWPQLAPVLRSVWSEQRGSGQREVVDGLLRAIDRMEEERPAEFLAALRTGPVPEPAAVADPAEEALELAAATAEDGSQRALDDEARDLEDLLELRLEVRERLAASPVDSALRAVRPWIWNAATTDGVGLTPAGERTGAELRLSRYREAPY